MASAGYGTVCIAALAHEASVVHIVSFHLSLSLLGCDALLLCVSDESVCLFFGKALLLSLLLSCSYHGVNTAELNEFVDIFLLVGIVERIYDSSACDIKTFGVLSDDDEVSHICLEDLLGSLKSSLVHRFGKYDSLFVSFCPGNDVINKCHIYKSPFGIFSRQKYTRKPMLFQIIK